MAARGDTVFGLLLRPSARTTRWMPLAVITVVAIAVVREGSRDGRDAAAVALPIATTLLGIWTCLAFEDDAAELTSSAPVPLWVRRSVRASVTVSATALVWFGLTWVGTLEGPTVPTTAMFVSISLVALASAAIAARRMPSDRSGLTATVGVVGVTVALPFVLGLSLDRPIAIDPSRVVIGEPVSYWATIGAIAVLLLALAHRDPAVPGISARLRRPTHRGGQRRPVVSDLVDPMRSASAPALERSARPPLTR